MAYIIARTIKTPARYSVDGKEHKRKNYYIGADSFGGFGIQCWGKKEQAKRYEDIRHAWQTAGRLGVKCEVLEVKG